MLFVIYKLWTQDNSIMSGLEERGLKSRTGKVWSNRVIKAIVKIIDGGTIVLHSGKLVLSEEFLNGMSSLPKASTKNKKKKL